MSPPPATETSLPAAVSSAAASATSTVPLSNGSSSKAPNGPFQTSVLARRQHRDRRARCCAGRCRGSCRRPPTASTPTTREGALASNFCATTASTGSTISQPCAFGLGEDVARGVGEVVLGQRLADRLALRGRKVLAMPPPMISASTLSIRLPSRSSLVETLAPPTIADDRALRRFQRLRQRLELGLHGAAGIGRQLVAEPFGRGVRAVRGGEGVVDPDVAELGERGDEGRIVLLLALVEARVLQAAGCRRASSRRRRLRAFSPMQSSAKATGRPMIVRDCGGDRLAAIPSDRGPSAGRNATSRITLPPLSAISVMVGATRSMRVASVTLPFSIGTLRSTRSSTRLPFTSASSRVRKFACDSASS